ncbi:CorA family metal ion transporter [Arthroderma uncinatum]|uniref:CorA family metal ion transporter n=1 Tax=Arthroderma uncinatum TaxID=74035 RepID=UPI00144AAA6F|nr:CorA family metal ion transporter [Arthroderma uncinatum]KAF3483434.1 CorA family metal ion transporter [Arthroderma uncinatum]
MAPVRQHSIDGSDISPRAVDVEAQASGDAFRLEPFPSASPSSARHPFGLETQGSIRRRSRRSTTARPYYPEIHSPNWHPGEEPGIDPADPSLPTAFADEGTLLQEQLYQRCDITVVDFSQEAMRMYHLDNATLVSFLEREREPWVQCRWINVNGLSWDVVRLLANHKGLHRLAVEDLMHSVNRTKVDWFSDHTFIVLAMQKLIKQSSGGSPEDSEAESEAEEGDTGEDADDSKPPSRHSKTKNRGVIMTALMDLFIPKYQQRRQGLRGEKRSTLNQPHEVPASQPRAIRSLQRFRGGPNEDRIDFMERHAVLSSKGLSVGIEQVSLFLHSDNSVTSFFEASADDIEPPIIQRLRSPGTILRQSCDASMILQAIIDAITDLAIPVTMAYQDAIGDLEVQVLTDPDIKQSSSLYILTSEISVLRNAIQPIIGVINSLRDHKSATNNRPQLGFKTASSPCLHTNNSDSAPSSRVTSHPETEGVKMPSTVTISPMCQTYLGDVLDHCITINEGYDQMRRSADNMIDLIFNTIGAYQNESITQLSLVTCMFLPLTFLSGYFGMNFKSFSSIEVYSDAFFWAIAIPFVFVVMVILMREMIKRYLMKLANKRLIWSSRRRRRPARQRPHAS